MSVTPLAHVVFGAAQLGTGLALITYVTPTIFSMNREVRIKTVSNDEGAPPLYQVLRSGMQAKNFVNGGDAVKDLMTDLNSHLDSKDLRKIFVRMFVVVAVCAAISGLAGYGIGIIAPNSSLAKSLAKIGRIGS